MEESLEQTLDGEYGGIFKSEGERRIAQVLNQYGIPFIYEPKLPVIDDGVTRNLVPDFFLPAKNLFIEFYGRAGNAEYDRRVLWKESVYASNGISVLALYPWDLCHDWPGRFINYVNGSQTAVMAPHYGLHNRAARPYTTRSSFLSYSSKGGRRYK
jgi:hypothetical protein